MRPPSRRAYSDMWNRLRRMWALAGKKPEEVALMMELPDEVLASMEDEAPESAYFGPGTVEEHERMVAEDNGTAEWLDRLKRL